MLKVGQEVILKFLCEIPKEPVNGGCYPVALLNGECSGHLIVKGKLKIKKDGTVHAWLKDFNPTTGKKYRYGNSYFGKYSILDSFVQKYISIIDKLYATPYEINDEEISVLKGMVNRTIKQDQWDWYTTYQYIGFPSKSHRVDFVEDCVDLRDAIREYDYRKIIEFREAYNDIFSNMRYNLNHEFEVTEEILEIPPSQIDNSIWNSLSLNTRYNLKIVEDDKNHESKYMLMHYFVSVEHEFYRNIIAPFISSYCDELRGDKCHIHSNQILHNVLLGRVHFSLGNISYLGDLVSSSVVDKGSKVLNTFTNEYLSHKDEFVELCKIISSAKIGEYNLVDLRNGLAHGDDVVINNMSKDVYEKMKELLYDPAYEVLTKIVRLSKI